MASRLSRASKLRNAVAHPDGSLVKDILQSSPSLEALLVGAGDGDAAAGHPVFTPARVVEEPQVQLADSVVQMPAQKQVHVPPIKEFEDIDEAPQLLGRGKGIGEEAVKATKKKRERQRSSSEPAGRKDSLSVFLGKFKKFP